MRPAARAELENTTESPTATDAEIYAMSDSLQSLTAMAARSRSGRQTPKPVVTTAGEIGGMSSGIRESGDWSLFVVDADEGLRSRVDGGTNEWRVVLTHPSARHASPEVSGHG